MELEALRTKLAEHRANAERISKDEAAAREQLATISKAAKAAAGYANEKAIFAEIDTSPEAKATAEKATATYATAFARQTEISDRLPLLSAARQKLDEEIVEISRSIKLAENKLVGDTLTPSLDQIDAEIVAVTGKLLARARAMGIEGRELPDLLKDRIQGSADATRPPLRDRIFAEAEKVRATITAARA
jgi:hypothetical protein